MMSMLTVDVIFLVLAWQSPNKFGHLLLLRSSVRNFIDLHSSFVVFYPFSNNGHQFFPRVHADEIQFGSTAVARMDAHGLQPGQLLQQAAPFPEVHHTVEFNVLVAPGEHPMLVDKLLVGDSVHHTLQVDETVN